jgi:hypothetical protein
MLKDDINQKPQPPPAPDFPSLETLAKMCTSYDQHISVPLKVDIVADKNPVRLIIPCIGGPPLPMSHSPR